MIAGGRGPGGGGGSGGAVDNLLNSLAGRDNGGWGLSAQSSGDLRKARQRFFKRAGGKKQAIGAMVLAGTASTLALQDVPYVPAALVGAAGGALALQLPAGNYVGDVVRTAGKGAASVWDCVTDRRNWPGQGQPRHRWR
eukprot:TRINITY_DN112124_c0_g1_i1.p1 TRINITY_DN112124_c0_g1~~TRINITY_DN112124_c0_g1_i1.p1  ORF type:complete len:139 (+),score=22.40 TRINITY_DN112124_c0_g1_i1:215-631(+)